VDTSISPIAVAAQGHKGVLRALANLGVQSAASALAAAAAAAADSDSPIAVAAQGHKGVLGALANLGVQSAASALAAAAAAAADSEPAPKKPKLEAGEMADSGGAGEETKT
jgi:fructose-specific phosphotransferase system component IIB